MSIAYFPRIQAELARFLKPDYSVTWQVEKLGDRNEEPSWKETPASKKQHVADAYGVLGVLY